MKTAKFSSIPFYHLQSSFGCRSIYLSSRLADKQNVLPKVDNEVRNCNKILGVSDESSNEEVKEAYLRLAKQYHPDSISKISSTKSFVDIENAYRTVMDHRKAMGKIPKDMEEVVFDIKHTAPQHRQYLTFDGVGYGTPSQRQHQYEQRKAAQAVDSIYEYRTQKISALYENTMITKDKKETKKRTIRNAIDRLCEDLIQESMAKGDFDNLPGSGKPLPDTNCNPYIDTMTHNINKILINNGYVPNWVTLEKEIRQTLNTARDDLLKVRIFAGSEPMPANKKQLWNRKLLEFCDTISAINLKIDRLNMIVPTLRQQMVQYSASKEIEAIQKHFEELQKNPQYPVSSSSDISSSSSSFPSVESNNWYTVSNSDITGEKVTFNVVLKELKALFGKS